MVSKVFEKLVNNRITDHLEKCDLFSEFQYGFMLDQLQIFSELYLIELLGLLRSEATRAVALDISKAFDRVWHAGLLHKLKSYGI